MPLPRGVMKLILKSDSDLVLIKGPQCLPEPVIVLLLPLACQEAGDGLSTLKKVAAIPPLAVCAQDIIQREMCNYGTLEAVCSMFNLQYRLWQPELGCACSTHPQLLAPFLLHSLWCKEGLAAAQLVECPPACQADRCGVITRPRSQEPCCDRLAV